MHRDVPILTGGVINGKGGIVCVLKCRGKAFMAKFELDAVLMMLGSASEPHRYLSGFLLISCFGLPVFIREFRSV